MKKRVERKKAQTPWLFASSRSEPFSMSSWAMSANPFEHTFTSKGNGLTVVKMEEKKKKRFFTESGLAMSGLAVHIRTPAKQQAHHRNMLAAAGIVQGRPAIRVLVIHVR